MKKFLVLAVMVSAVVFSTASARMPAKWTCPPSDPLCMPPELSRPMRVVSIVPPDRYRHGAGPSELINAL